LLAFSHPLLKAILNAFPILHNRCDRTTQEGVSLKNEKKKIFPSPKVKTSLLNEEATPENNNNGSLSFIDLTASYTKDTTPPFLSSFIPDEASQGSPPCTKELLACGLEIRMPSGVMLKVGPVPFSALWPQVVEFVRALA
jgi:hypothetical protein